MARKRRRPRNRMRNRDMAERQIPMKKEEVANTVPQTGMGVMSYGDEVPVNNETGNEASPEEQAIYHRFMENYYTIMYVGGSGQGGKKEPPLADSNEFRSYFTEIEDPVDALANASLSIVNELAGSAQNAGKPIPPDVLMHAGVEVLEDIAEFAENAGYHEYSEEELNSALIKAMELYREIHQGDLNTDALKQDYESLLAADQEGRLEDVLPGVGKAAERMSTQSQEPIPEEEIQEQQGIMPRGARRV